MRAMPEWGYSQACLPSEKSSIAWHHASRLYPIKGPSKGKHIRKSGLKAWFSSGRTRSTLDRTRMMPEHREIFEDGCGTPSSELIYC